MALVLSVKMRLCGGDGLCELFGFTQVADAFENQFERLPMDQHNGFERHERMCPKGTRQALCIKRRKHSRQRGDKLPVIGRIVKIDPDSQSVICQIETEGVASCPLQKG